MPKINSVVVQVGDVVHDISNGPGTVVALSEKTIEVKFSNGRRQSFNEHGFGGDVRRLYWHNPIFLDPPKNKAAWDKLLKAMTAIFRIIEGY